MATDVEKAASRNDVYDLVRLSYVYEGRTGKLREIGAALEAVVSRLDPAKQRDELAYATKALKAPELLAAVNAARATQGLPPCEEPTTTPAPKASAAAPPDQGGKVSPGRRFLGAALMGVGAILIAYGVIIVLVSLGRSGFFGAVIGAIIVVAGAALFGVGRRMWPRQAPAEPPSSSG